MGKKRKRKGYCGSRTGPRTRHPSAPSGEEDRDPRSLEELQNRGLKRLEGDLSEDGFILRETAPSHRKLSEVLLEFVNDVLELEAPFTEPKELLDYAVMVWHMGFLDSKSDRSVKEQMISKTMATIQRDMYPKLFDMLLARKQRDYPNDRRFIRKIDVSEESGHLFVNVASIDFDNPHDR